MASKKTLTAGNLEALGAERLAGLLMEIAAGDAATQRRLRLELAAREAPERVAAEVRKRLAQIERGRSFADWRKVRALATDLETQRRAIVEQVAKIDAGEALDLMWRFMELADSVHDRSDDSNGEIGDVFGSACRDLGPLAEKAKPDHALCRAVADARQEAVLSARHLRAWLDRLPDFEDDEAERRALDHAGRHKSLLEALSFLIAWKALDRAARLVIDRRAELDGDHYESLTPAAQELAEKHPLAATLLLRAMVEFALTKARAGRYRHAARHFAECASLAASIPTFEPVETHETWAARLKSRHGRTWGFWSIITPED